MGLSFSRVFNKLASSQTDAPVTLRGLEAEVIFQRLAPEAYKLCRFIEDLSCSLITPVFSYQLRPPKRAASYFSPAKFSGAEERCEATLPLNEARHVKGVRFAAWGRPMSIVVSRRSVLPQQIFITLMPEKGHPEAGKPDFVKLEQGLIPIGKGTLGVRDNTHPYSPDIVRGIADVFVTRAINAGLIAPSAARNNLFPAPLSPQP